MRDDPLAQRANLRNALLCAGWGTVPIHPIIVGNAVAITSETLLAFKALCLRAAARLNVALRLAVDSIRRTANIKRKGLSHAAGPTTLHSDGDPGGSAGSDADAGAEPPVVNVQPHVSGADPHPMS